MTYKLLINYINGDYDRLEKTMQLKSALDDTLRGFSIIEGSEVYLAIAYIKESGLAQFRSKLVEILRKNGKVRILTCLDFGLTEPKVLRNLQELKKDGDIKIRIFYNGNNSFHPKFYLFQNKQENKIIIGSNNLTYSAFKTNIECAIIEEKSELFEDLKSYFYSLWRESYEVVSELIEEYSKISKKAKKQNVEINDRLQSLLLEQERRDLEIFDENIVEGCISYINKIRKILYLDNKILFWRDCATDEIITLLEESDRLKSFSPRQLILKLIQEDKLHYKSTQAEGAWLNYKLLMEKLGFWKDDKISFYGKIALEKYKNSYLD